jgi:hypothetical protein
MYSFAFFVVFAANHKASSQENAEVTKKIQTNLGLILQVWIVKMNYLAQE